MRLVTGSIRSGENTRASTNAPTQGRRPTPSTTAVRRRDAARKPVAAPSMRKSAMTPTMRRIFAH
jgi:hypothetical protein